MSELLEKFQAVPASQKAVLLVILMIGVGAGWYFLMFEDTQTAIEQAQRTGTQLTKDLSDQEQVKADLQKYQAQIEQLEKDRDAMRDRLPENAEIADLLQKIHGQAKIVGLTIARFEREPTVPESTFARIPVQMQLRGTFHEVATFFYYLGKIPRIVNVENIHFKAQREEGKTMLDATCTATTFMYLPPAAPSTGKKKKGGGH